MKKKISIKVDDMDHIEDVISRMDFKPGYGYDLWYPTEEELDRFIEETLPKQTDEEKIAFLVWLARTEVLSEEHELTEEKKKVRQKVMDILAGDEVLDLIQDPNDLYYPEEPKKETGKKVKKEKKK